MRRLILPACTVALLALLVSTASGKKQDAAKEAGAPAFTTVTEAAFSLRSTKTEDASSFLIGNFAGDQSSGKLVFDGEGSVRRVQQDLSYTSGSYCLVQSEDGAAILWMELDGGEQLYSFSVASPEGGFVLRDASGETETFMPVM